MVATTLPIGATVPGPVGNRGRRAARLDKPERRFVLVPHHRVQLGGGMLRRFVSLCRRVMTLMSDFATVLLIGTGARLDAEHPVQGDGIDRPLNVLCDRGIRPAEHPAG